jgi:peptide/nickel transport system substrate-binding protein
LRAYVSDRRARVSLAIALAIASLVVVGTGVSARTNTASSASQIVVGQVAEPKSLDPGADTAVNDFRILVNIYDGLVRYAPGSLDVIPSLATKWTITQGGTIYTFTLRKGVKFHDGTPFNAQAVKFNFDRLLNPKAPGHQTGPFPLAQQYFGDIKSVTVMGANIVRFTLKAPSAALLSNLAYPTGLIVSPAAVQKFGTSFGLHPVGTGAFAFSTWQASQKVVLTANSSYWQGAPRTKTLIFRPLPDPSSRVAALKSGGADLIVEVPPDDLAALAKSSQFAVQQQAGPHVWFLILNCKSGPFKDVRMRQAANYAIDKSSIVKDVLQNTATVANGPIAKAFGAAYDNALQGYPYNEAKARDLVKQAGYPNGVDVNFYVTESGSGMLDPKAMAEAIQAELGQVGIRVHIQTFEWNTYLSKVNAGLEGKADMAEMAWMTNDPGTLPYLTLRTASWPDKGGFNSGYYSDPQVDKLLDAQAVATNPAKRDQLFHQMQEIVVKDAPWVFVASWRQNAAMVSGLKGFQLHPSFVLYFNHAYKVT